MQDPGAEERSAGRAKLLDCLSFLALWVRMQVLRANHRTKIRICLKIPQAFINQRPCAARTNLET